MRYERKFRTEEATLSAVQLITRMHPACFRQLYPPRWVNNLYFDTPEFAAFNDNASGAPNRVKYRLRWYGRPFERLKDPVLEIKWKEGEVGSKRGHALDKGIYLLPQLGELADVARNLIHKGKELQPVLFNSYYRSYYGAANGQFRLTIDSSLQFGAYRPSGGHLLPFQLPGIIMEVKYPLEEEPNSDLIFQNLPFRQTKSSKYVMGLGLVYGLT